MLPFSVFSRTLTGLGLIAVLGLLLVVVDDSSITIQSRESKTHDGSPIFNEISFQPGVRKDTWMMKQSHHGLKLPSQQWDRIAIVVDKARNTAEFYQLNQGPLQWTSSTKAMNYKVSCYMCHANGPRAIRPDLEGHKLATWDRLRIKVWNLRIKSYGLLKSEFTPGKTPFRISGPFANKVLQVGVCVKCHKKKGFMARGELTRQHELPIRFMVNNGLMPPLGFRLTHKERDEINQFIN